MRSRRGILQSIPLLLICLFSSTMHAEQPYKVIAQWKTGGDGFWDYLTDDPAAHRLYVTHGTKVEVIDTDSGKIAATISGLHGVHGVALDDAGKFGYISDGGGNSVVVFDRSNMTTVATIPTGGQGPDSIVFEPVTKTVWAFEGRSKDAAVIDASTQKVLALVPLAGRPEAPAVDGKGNVYDNLEDKNSIIRIDAKMRSVTATWPVTGCDGPSGLAMDEQAMRLFPVCDGKKMGIVDANTGKTIATAAIGDGPDAAGYDSAHKLAFASSGDGNLAVVDTSSNKFPTVQLLHTQQGARTMAYDSAADRIYVATADFGPRPEPTADHPHPRPSILPGTFTILVIGR